MTKIDFSWDQNDPTEQNDPTGQKTPLDPNDLVGKLVRNAAGRHGYIVRAYANKQHDTTIRLYDDHKLFGLVQDQFYETGTVPHDPMSKVFEIYCPYVLFLKQHIKVRHLGKPIKFSSVYFSGAEIEMEYKVSSDSWTVKGSIERSTVTNLYHRCNELKEEVQDDEEEEGGGGAVVQTINDHMVTATQNLDRLSRLTTTRPT